MKKIKNRDIEKVYTKGEFIKKLRRLADSLEKGKKFSIQVAGEKVGVPKDAIINIEHEKNESNEELEFQIKWKNLNNKGLSLKC
jgi:amphi-Trp domain-containing protein